MESFDPSPYIEESNRLTAIFGYWPSFHDAEIKELHLDVADGEPWRAGSESPTIEMLIHVFEMTKDVTPDGYFVLTKHTLVRLHFRNIEKLELSDFSYQNCIFDLEFALEPMSYPAGGGPVDRPPPNVLKVKINSSCGLSGGFKCQTAKVVSAEPCDDNGHLTAGSINSA